MLEDDPDEELWPAYDTYFDCPRSNYVVLDDKVELPTEAFQRVEYTHMIILVMGEEAEVAWRASPKSASVYVTTNSLPQTFVEEAARGEGTPICQ